jgi:tRNA (guanosine-2'-O-)-methyltransferase
VEIQTTQIISQLGEFILSPRKQRIEEILNSRTRQITVVLDEIRNEHNIAAVLRSLDGFGLQDIHFIGDKKPHSAGVSLGSERWLSVFRHENSSLALDELGQKEYKIVTLTAPLSPSNLASAIDENSIIPIPIYSLPLNEKLALVFGNEQRGVSAEIQAAATYRCYIPMYGFVESFNISVAAAVTLSSLRERAEREQVDFLSLSEDEKNELRLLWYTQSIPSGERVLKEIQNRLS